jgi:hypothetical protein
VLVVDRDASTLADRRLVAHLAPDEPSENARLISGFYLEEPASRWCRRVSAEDFAFVPFCERRSEPVERSEESSARPVPPLSDHHGWTYQLELVATHMSIPELRWCRSGVVGARPQPLSVRELVACLESYEPVLDITAAALAAHQDDKDVSITTLRAELERIRRTRIVLNRGLREAVLNAIAGDGLSMSEIAIRCGRVKRDARGVQSGETSWLARRVGMLPESGVAAPTPWIHSDVLGLIARRGLGISPREVELG